MRNEETSDDAEVLFDARDGRVDVSLATAFEETFPVRFTRWEFARLLWQGWVVLIRSL